MSVAAERVRTEIVHGFVKQTEATGDNLLRGRVLLLCLGQLATDLGDLIQQTVDVAQGSGESLTG